MVSFLPAPTAVDGTTILQSGAGVISLGAKPYSLRTEFQASGGAESGTALTTGVTRYLEIGTFAVGAINAVEANVARSCAKATTVNEVVLFILTNTATGAGTVTLRKNAGATAFTAAIGAGAAGAITLAGGPVTFATGDTWDVQVVAGTGGTTTVAAVEVAYFR